MGQYFHLINHDREEYVSLPSGMKAIERVTDAKSMGMLGYLLFESNVDGSGFSNMLDLDDNQVREALTTFKEREHEIEQDQYRKYITGERNYAASKWEREYGEEPDRDDFEDFQIFCWDQARSVYRDSDGDWDEQKMKAAAVANYAIDEVLEYAGRWAGDRIALVGDYAEGESAGWYDQIRPLTIAETPSGEEVALRGTRERVDWDGSGSTNSDGKRWATESGERIELSSVHHSGDERVVAEVITVEDAPYENITDGLMAEFEAFVGEDWLENTDESVLSPDVAISN